MTTPSQMTQLGERLASNAAPALVAIIAIESASADSEREMKGRVVDLACEPGFEECGRCSEAIANRDSIRRGAFLRLASKPKN